MVDKCLLLRTKGMNTELRISSSVSGIPSALCKVEPKAEFRLGKGDVIASMGDRIWRGLVLHDDGQCTHWHWECECGAHSRGGDIKADARTNAIQHQLRKTVGHPEPRVYREGCP